MALSNTTTLTRELVSSDETISSNCGMFAGPKIFNGGRSKVTRQYSGDTRARRISPATIALLMLFSLLHVRGCDRARLLRLAGAPGERSRIDCRTSAEHRIVRRPHTRRQRQRVEVDIRGSAEFLRLDSI